MPINKGACAPYLTQKNKYYENNSIGVVKARLTAQAVNNSVQAFTSQIYKIFFT